MRIFKSTFAAATLGSLLGAASCTLITDVDRTKIPTDSGAGTSGTGGTTAGTGSGGKAGETGEAGGGGAPEGGSGGTTAGDAGSGGDGGVVSSCSKATGTITLSVDPRTYIAEKDYFTLGDGVNDPIDFEFDCSGETACSTAVPGVEAGRVEIHFDGTEDEAGLAQLITAAINGVGAELGITATTASTPDDTGAGGEGGTGNGGGGVSAGGIDSGAGAPTSGSGGTGASADVVILLTNDANGALGDVPITNHIGNPHFKHTGMSGGQAVACDASPTLCDDDADCAGSCDTDAQLCQ